MFWCTCKVAGDSARCMGGGGWAWMRHNMTVLHTRAATGRGKRAECVESRVGGLCARVPPCRATAVTRRRKTHRYPSVSHATTHHGTPSRGVVVRTASSRDRYRGGRSGAMHCMVLMMQAVGRLVRHHATRRVGSVRFFRTVEGRGVAEAVSQPLACALLGRPTPPPPPPPSPLPRALATHASHRV